MHSRFIRFIRSGLPLILAATLIAGCASQQAHRLIAEEAVQVPASEIAASHTILIATTRARSTQPGEPFSGDRAPTMSFARVDVTVPASHKPGRVERARDPRVADPARYFTASELGIYRDEDAFESTLRKDIARRNGRVLVFIHGFNTGFDAAVYRLTQIVQDSGYSGTPLLFSWASAGRIVDYVYDNNSATVARDALERTLRVVASAGAKRIDIVAHSMGAWVTMEALRQLAITDDRDLSDRLADVVLASPDIDFDVFKSQMRRYGKPDRPFLVLTARNDRALSLSSFIAGRPRVGDYSDAKALADLGVTVVDLTGASPGQHDRLNHTKFADNPLLIRYLGEQLNNPESLGGESSITDRIDTLTRGVGQAIGSAAEIIITTPLEVLGVALGN